MDVYQSITAKCPDICINMLWAKKEGLFDLDDETEKVMKEIISASAKKIVENKDMLLKVIADEGNNIDIDD